MSATERIIFQPYVTGRGNSLLPGQAGSAETRTRLGGAPRRPWPAVASPEPIVRVLEDAAAGDYGEPEYLAESPMQYFCGSISVAYRTDFASHRPNAEWPLTGRVSDAGPARAIDPV
jgi:hypothetical protein